MKNFFPKTGSEPEWSAARARVEVYLRALHMTDEEQLARIILRLLERAAGRHAQNPGLCPTTLAIAEVRAALDKWLGPISSCRERAAVTGMLSLLAADTPEKWSAVFLAEDIPADFVRDLLERPVRAVPDLKVTSMVPQSFANPLREVIQSPIRLGKPVPGLASLMTKAAASMLSVLSILRGVRLR